MKPADITYTTSIEDRWREALIAADDMEKFHTTLYEWRELFPDAYAARPKPPEEFDEWRKGMEKEYGIALDAKGYKKRKTFAGVPWATRWAQILLPDALIECGQIAEKFCVPTGCAFIRIAEERKRASDAREE